MNPASVTFTSAGVTCDAWHLPATSDALATSAGRPAVVMAHGFGGTKDSGLLPFAEGLAAGGLDVLAFDYRGFGASDGEPRQVVSLRGQVADYRAALTAAAGLPGVDAGRLVPWGVSLAGGTVFEVAAGRSDVAAVVALTPLVDGRAAARHALRSHPAGALARSGAVGLRAKLAERAGRPPVTMPLVARPGELGALTLPGLYEEYHALAGPTWRNEIGATITTDLGRHRPIRFARQVRCPVLVQVADFDRSAPPAAAMRAAERARAQVRHYPCDHFDVYAGHPWHESVIAHQVRFLQRALAPQRVPVA